ncbi:MAG: cysteine--tRNA ligase [Deltaproteobacteria bacterium RIFCSPHIGHO2_02_FULL_40_11]|nr:MAG: cysteine--tRNA ligase [Deltaproteobacteria bacterium RIFCSPHIGHO2_02_FULL_40_11]
MSLTFYNTQTRQKEKFEPLFPHKVTLYVCGPTVYNMIHVGNARPMVFFDVLSRYLKYKGYDVTYVRNITDIDDKIIQRAASENKDPQEIVSTYTQTFHEDMKALHVVNPTVEPKATDHIQEMIQMIQTLIQKGIAYEVQGEILYEIQKFKDYGLLSKKPLEDLVAGARVEVAKHKKHPGDFVLWKPSKEGEPSWESPWGKGRPGWHLECSVMSTKYLSETFDIHGGGVDLIFPHHENEIAQSQACSGKVPVKYWVHNAHVLFGKEKMSKSLGNVILVHEFLKKYPAEVLRFILLSNHYRSELEFSEPVIQESVVAVERVYKTLKLVKAQLKLEAKALDPINIKLKESVEKLWEKVEQAMENDLNTAESFGIVFEGVRAINSYLKDLKPKHWGIEGKKVFETFLKSMEKFSQIFGLFQEEPEIFLKDLRGKLLNLLSPLQEKEILKFIQDRTQARKEKDFQKADQIREDLKKNNIILEDGPLGTDWNVKV